VRTRSVCSVWRDEGPSRACSQTLAAALASTTIGNEGLEGSRGGLSVAVGESYVVADADVEEPGGQHVGPTGGTSEVADYKETPSEVGSPSCLSFSPLIIYISRVCVG
jgi:hypothetical protein